MIHSSTEKQQAAHDYYRAKEKVYQSFVAHDNDTYREALDTIARCAEILRDMVPDEAQQAVGAALDAGTFEPDFIGEWEELLQFSGNGFSPCHREIIKSSALRILSLVIPDSEKVPSIVADIEQIAHPLNILNVIPHDPATLAVSRRNAYLIRSLLHFFSNARKMGMYGATLSFSGQHRICVAPIDDIVLFEASVYHEIMHYLSLISLSQVDAFCEIISQALSSYVIAAKRGFLEPEESLYKQLFEYGCDLAARGELITDVERLSFYAANVARHYLESLGDKTSFVIDSESLQRMIGTILAGQAFERERKEGVDALGHILAYCNELVAPLYPRPLSEAEKCRALSMLEQFNYVSQTLLEDYILHLTPFREMEKDEHFQRWRYIKPFHELQVPLCDLLIEPSAAKGLFFQELFRILFHNPSTIEEPLRNNPYFMALYAVLITIYVVNRGKYVYPGAGIWLVDFYENHYAEEDKDFILFKYRHLDRSVQFLESSLYEERMCCREHRCDDPLVTELLDKTRDARSKAVREEEEATYYRIVRDQIWPHYRDLCMRQDKEEQERHTHYEFEDAAPEDSRESSSECSASSKDDAEENRAGQESGNGHSQAEQRTSEEKEELSDDETPGADPALSNGKATDLHISPELSQDYRLLSRSLGSGVLPQQLTHGGKGQSCKENKSATLKNAFSGVEETGSGESGSDAARARAELLDKDPARCGGTESCASPGRKSSATDRFTKVRSGPEEISPLHRYINDDDETLSVLVEQKAAELQGLPSSDINEYANFIRPFRSLISSLRKQIEPMFDKRNTNEMTKCSSGGEIDEESLALAPAGGLMFKRTSFPDEIEAYVSILVDVSGSTEDSGCLTSLIALALICFEALKEIKGVNFEIYGFSTDPAIRMKDHSDPATLKCACQIYNGLLSCQHLQTRDAEALKAAALRVPSRIQRDRSIMKLFIVLTDGVTDKRRIQSTIYTLMRAGQNLRVLAAGIGKGAETVPDAYGDLGIFIERVCDLPVRFGRFLADILRARVMETRHNLLKEW